MLGKFGLLIIVGFQPIILQLGMLARADGSWESKNICKATCIPYANGAMHIDHLFLDRVITPTGYSSYIP